VGYLLEALDPEAHREVEAHLQAHPEARARLELLRQGLSPLAADREDPPAPPPGLVVSTLARVAELRCRRLPDAPPPSPRQAGPRGRRWARRADLIAAAVLLLLVGGLTAPLLVRQWVGYQREACSDNLRQFWLGLQAYSDRSEEAFPRVEAEGARGVAGIFVPILNDAGVLPEVSVTCPAHGHRPPPPQSVGDLEELYRTHPEQFQTVVRGLAGDYAYCLGYREGETHRHLNRHSGDLLPILADRPSPHCGNSLNHGGAGQNVLYVGGAVRWCTTSTVGVDLDDIYLNRDRQVQAGLSRVDSVLAASDARPYR
jgi:hypothetical protein